MQDPRAVVADIEFIAGAMREFGLTANVVDMPGGVRGIQSVTSGIPFTAFLFKNDEGGSPYLLLSAMLPGKTADLAWANTWNKRFPLTRATIGETGEPMLTHAVLLTGVTTDHLKVTAGWWDLLLRIFAQELFA